MFTRNGSAGGVHIINCGSSGSASITHAFPHSQYLDSFLITNTADGLFVFQGLVHFWYILTFHRQIAQTNRMFMFQYSLPARHTNNGLDILVQYPTAFRTSFAEELLNRQVLVGYLLLSYNDNRYSQRQLGDEAVVTLRGKNQPRTQSPRPRLISNFFYVALLMMTSPFILCFKYIILQLTVCSLQSAVCGLRSAVCSLRSAVCSLQSAVCKCHTPPASRPSNHRE